MADPVIPLRSEPHPFSGAIYEELGDGIVRVTDKQKGRSGLFRWTGEWIEGDLTQADPHLLDYVGGPTMPPEKDIVWSVLPVADLGQRLEVNAPFLREGVTENVRDRIVAPYVSDPGIDTEDGKRATSHLPIETFFAADTRKELIPEYYKNRSPYPGGPKKVNVARFHERKYHDLEVEHIWKRCWQMACREDDIPEVGDYHLYKIASLEFIVVRTAESEIKAYRNACLHRGRRLCSHDGKKASAFRCPYHGWTWNIDGRLKELTCEWDFPGIRDEVSHLPEARTATWGGYVFINPDPNCMSFEEYAGPEMIEYYRKMKLENRYKQIHVGQVISCNWKLMLEAFSEAYHNIATHPQLLLFGGDLTDTRYDVFGNFSRLGHIPASTSSALRGLIHSEETNMEVFRGIAAFNREYLRGLIGDEVDQFSDAEMAEQSFNQLFPNLSPWGGWSRLSYRFRPHGDNPGECILDIMLLAPWPEGKPKPPAAKLQMIAPGESWTSAADLGTIARIVDQDIGNVPDVHEGLKTKEPPYVIYSAHQESVIRAFHDQYERRLGLNEGE